MESSKILAAEVLQKLAFIGKVRNSERRGLEMCDNLLGTLNTSFLLYGEDFYYSGIEWISDIIILIGLLK